MKASAFTYQPLKRLIRRAGNNMPFDGFVTAAVVRQLNDEITGGRIEKVFSPTPDELLLLIRTDDRRNVKLCLSASSSIPKTHLTLLQGDNPAQASSFCMHMRKHLTSAKIIGTSQPDFERVIRIELDTTDEMGFSRREFLYSEIMGKCSNIILTDEGGKIVNVIKPVDFTTSSKRQVLPGMIYEAPPAQDKLIPVPLDRALADETSSRCEGEDADKFSLKNYRGFSPVLSREVSYRAGAAGKPISEKKSAVLASLSDIAEKTERGEFSPCIVYDKSGKPLEFGAFELLQYTDCEIRRFDSISECIDTFYAEKQQTERIKQRGGDVLRLLNSAEAHIKKKIANQKSDLLACEDMDSYRLYGDLITANIWRISRGERSVALEDYTSGDGSVIKIELDYKLTSSQNAQKYYKKYRKLKTAKDELTKRLAMSETELEYISTVLDALSRSETEDDIMQLRAELYDSGYASKMKDSSRRKPQKPKPMHFRTSGGYDVYIGKNNMQNEHLTLKEASREDWFFHVKGAAGSHVILISGGTEPDAEDFTQAAILAAYYSSKRDGENVDVDYTPVRNIKKPSGSPPGFVIYNKYYSATVTPDAELAKALRIM